MFKRDFLDKSPIINDKAFIAETACIIGEVEVGKDTSIWYSAVLRGDFGSIKIGEGSNVQDNSTVHSDPKYPTTIGDYVTIGHNCVIHGCTIKDHALIGMGAVVLDGAVIEEGAVIGAGALVKAGTVVPKNTLAVGNPLVIKGEVSEKTRDMFKKNCELYIDIKTKY